MQIDAFRTNGSSPPKVDLLPSRYQLNIVSFSVVREKGADYTLRPRLHSAHDVAKLAGQVIADDAKEHFWAMLLDVRNGVVAAHHVSTGTLSWTLAHPREVFGAALRVMGVAYLILVHNHPSGDVTPSREDLELTHRLVEAGRLLGITVLDHVIIGNGTDAYLSLVGEYGEAPARDRRPSASSAWVF